MSAKDIVLKFIERINSQNIEGMCNLMTEQHRFIDALGCVIEGREQMRQGWRGYFQMVPDYQILCEELMENGNVVAGFGSAGGTYSPGGGERLSAENRWQIPAAWRVEVENDLISEWRVYADNEPIRKLMAKKLFET